LLSIVGRLGEALPHNQNSVETIAKALGRDHPETLLARNNLCNNLVQMGRLADAAPDCLAVLDTRRAKLGAEHPSTLRSVLSTGRLRLRQGRTADVIALLEPVEPAFRSVFTGDKRYVLASWLTLLGGAHRRQGDFDIAERMLSEAEQLTSSLRSASPVARRELRVEQVLLYQDWNRADPKRGHAADENRWRTTLEQDRKERPMPELRWDDLAGGAATPAAKTSG
jgi:tetratricopeptide (TPR) repeat protein